MVCNVLTMLQYRVMVYLILFPQDKILSIYFSTFRSMCLVPSMAVSGLHYYYYYYYYSQLKKSF
jgi:hypothetical protein